MYSADTKRHVQQESANFGREMEKKGSDEGQELKSRMP
jgi:hypothetical protein